MIRGFGRFPMDVGVVVVPRADETPEAEQAPELFVALPAPGDVASLSSTKIRRLAEVNFDVFFKQKIYYTDRY